MDLIERFQESLFRRPPYSQIEELDNILLDDAVTITGNRWLGFQVIKNIVDLLRKQPNNLNILTAQQIQCKAKIEDEKRGSLKSAIDSTKNYIAILCNVRNNERYETAIRQDAFGNHWSIVLMDTSERTLIYCDSLSKKVPYNLKDFVNPVLQVLNLSYSQFSVQSAHHVLISGQHFHQCTGKCTGYPFQDDGNSCGIIATVCLAVLALGSKENFDYLTKPGIGRKHSLTCWVNNPTQYSKFLRFVLITWMEEKHIDLKVISWSCETGSAESIQSQIPALYEVNRSAESAELWTTAGKKTQHQSANHEIAGHEEEPHSGRTVEPKIPAGLVEDSGSADTADPQALAGQKEEPPSCEDVTASTPAGDEEKPRSFEAVAPVIPAGKEKEKWPSDAVDLSAFDGQEEEPQSPEAVETSVPIDQEEEPRYLESAEPCTTTGEEEENWSPEAVQTSMPADQGKEPRYPEFLEPLIPADQKEDHQSPEAVEPSKPASQEEEPRSSENVELCTPADQEAKHLSTEGAEPWTPAGQEAEAVPLSSDVSSHKDGQCCSRQVPILKRKLSEREEKELTFSKRRKKNHQETKRSSKKKNV